VQPVTITHRCLYKGDCFIVVVQPMSNKDNGMSVWSLYSVLHKCSFIFVDWTCTLNWIQLFYSNLCVMLKQIQLWLLISFFLTSHWGSVICHKVCGGTNKLSYHCCAHLHLPWPECFENQPDCFVHSDKTRQIPKGLNLNYRVF